MAIRRPSPCSCIVASGALLSNPPAGRSGSVCAETASMRRHPLPCNSVLRFRTPFCVSVTNWFFYLVCMRAQEDRGGASLWAWRLSNYYWQGSHTTSISVHSLQRERLLPCTQMEPPPHSLHVERNLSCTQMAPPPHSLHVERLLSCTQMEPPPHSLHVERLLSCTQMALPPHSLHVERTLSCTQMALPPHSLHSLRFPRRRADVGNHKPLWIK